MHGRTPQVSSHAAARPPRPREDAGAQAATAAPAATATARGLPTEDRLESTRASSAVSLTPGQLRPAQPERPAGPGSADVSESLLVAHAPKEGQVAAAIEALGGEPLVRGGTFVPLQRAQRVAPSRALIVQDLQTGAFHAGAHARRLLGLGSDKTQLLDPGAHPGFAVFSQTWSRAPALPPGTPFLYTAEPALRRPARERASDETASLSWVATEPASESLSAVSAAACAGPGPTSSFSTDCMASASVDLTAALAFDSDVMAVAATETLATPSRSPFSNRPSIGRTVLRRQLERAEPGSAFAAWVERAPSQLTATGLQAQVEAFLAAGQKLSAKEEATLRRVSKCLDGSAARLPDTRREELEPVVRRGVIQKPEPEPVVELPELPAFSAPNAPRRVPSTEPLPGGASWTKDLFANPVAPPLLSLDHQRLFLVTAQGELLALDRATGDVKQRVTCGGSWSMPALTPDGQNLLVAADNGASLDLISLDPATLKERWRAPLSQSSAFTGLAQLSSPALSADGRTAFIATAAGELRSIDVATGQTHWNVPTVQNQARMMGPYHPVLSPDGARLFVTDLDTGVTAYDAATGEKLWRVSHGNFISGNPVVSPDGTRVYVAGTSTLSALDAETGQHVWQVPVDACSENQTPVVTSDGGTLLLGSSGGTLYVFDTENGNVRHAQNGGPSLGEYFLGAPALSADESSAFFYDIAMGRFVELDLQSGNVSRLGSPTYEQCTGFTVSPDGRFAYMGYEQLRSIPLR